MNHFRGIEDPAMFIKETRNLLDITQLQMSRSIGISLQAISNWETRLRSPPPLALEWCMTARKAMKAARERKKSGGTDWTEVLVNDGLNALVDNLLPKPSRRKKTRLTKQV